ncbi:MAG: ABC transporter ATP-binding protein [Christensenellales bacterium]
MGAESSVFRRYARIAKKPGGPGGFGGGGPGGPGRSRGSFVPGAKFDKGTTMRILKTVFLPYWPRMLVVFAAIVVSAQASVRASLFLRTLIDDYIKPLMTQESPVFTGLLHACLVMALIYIAGIFSTWLSNFLMVGVSQGTLKKLRDQLFTHMQKLPIKYFDTHTHGDVMSRYTNDIETMRQMIGMSIPQLFSTVVTVVTVFINMVLMSMWLTLFTLAFVFLMLMITKRIGAMSAKYFVAQQATLGALNGFIEEMINGQKVVKVFNHEPVATSEMGELNDALGEQAYQANKLGNILGPIMGNLGHLQYILLAVIGGALAIHGIGGLTLGTIAAFLQLSRSFTMPISQVSQQINSVVSALAGAQRVFAMIDEEPEPDEGDVSLVNAHIAPSGAITESAARTGVWAWKLPGGANARYQKVEGDVRLDQVDFAYVEGKPVLHDISLYAEPGQKVAFVGATGAGKTTITNLLNRFYDIQRGQIRYDGVDIGRIQKNDLRRALGIVLQETNLFTGTVMENIRYGKLDATDEEVYAAARLANADDFIRRLPMGYDTLLTANGASLSQGQRQLIAIARAAVADPPVMILDEATSSIDTRTELLVQRGMDRLMKGRTVFVIAHRLSTIRNADVIMVLDQGRIIERGPHEKLIAEQGQYYQLYTGAFELE